MLFCDCGESTPLARLFRKPFVKFFIVQKFVFRILKHCKGVLRVLFIHGGGELVDFTALRESTTDIQFAFCDAFHAAEVAEYAARLDGGELVCIADKSQTAFLWQGIQKFGHEWQVDHACLIDDEPVQRKRIVPVVLEADEVIIGFKEGMYGRG